MRLKRHALGVTLIVCVIILWVGSSELIQRILDSFDSPFFLTYVSTSLFNIFLVVHFVRTSSYCMKRRRTRASSSSSSSSSSSHHVYATTAATITPTNQTTTLVEVVSANDADADADAEEDEDDNDFDDDDDSKHHHHMLSFREHARAAIWLCPVWFGLNFTFNYSLSRTSLASNTILSSTSGVWTLILSRVVLHDAVKWYNVVGVVATVGGAVGIALTDSSSSSTSASSSHSGFGGDMWCLVSAMMYGVYTIMLKLWFKDDSRVDMQLLLGQIGFINVVLLWPGFFVVESFEWPSGRVFGYLVLNGVFGTVISDYLWARSVLLTTPIIATLGLTLTIPLAMVVDLVVNGKHFHPVYYIGSVCVVSGFVLVNWQYSREEHDNDDEEEEDGEAETVVGDDRYLLRGGAEDESSMSSAQTQPPLPPARLSLSSSSSSSSSPSSSLSPSSPPPPPP